MGEPAPQARHPLPLSLKILLFAAFVAAAGFLGLTYYGHRVAHTPVPPVNGYGHPVVVKSLAGGWKRYWFPELSLNLELPGQPKVAAPPRYTTDRRFSRGWSYYRATGGRISVLIRAFWPSFEFSRDPLALATEEMDNWARAQPKGTAESKSFLMDIDGRTAGAARATYVLNGRKAEAYVVYICSEDCHRSLWVSFWSSDRQASADWANIVRSVQLGSFREEKEAWREFPLGSGSDSIPLTADPGGLLDPAGPLGLRLPPPVGMPR